MWTVPWLENWRQSRRGRKWRGREKRGRKATSFAGQNISCLPRTYPVSLWRRANARNVRPAVHQPFYISICISTLPTQHTTFIMLYSLSPDKTKVWKTKSSLGTFPDKWQTSTSLQINKISNTSARLESWDVTKHRCPITNNPLMLPCHRRLQHICSKSVNQFSVELEAIPRRRDCKRYCLVISTA